MYRNDLEEEEEGYNMCRGLREWAEDERNAGREEGREEGAYRKLVENICKKLRKGREEAQIADELEEDEQVIHEICTVAEKYSPEYEFQKLYEELRRKKQKV